MKLIVVNNVKYRVHPIYENYAASKSGKVIHVKKLIPMNGHSHSFNKKSYIMYVTIKDYNVCS